MEQIENLNSEKAGVYRTVLYIILSFGTLLTLASAYYCMWCRVPSTIMVKAGVEQTLDFRLPASGEIYKDAVQASSQAKSNLDTESLVIDFRSPVTVKANQIENYKMQVKLFGVIPLKNVDVEVIQDICLKPAGIPIGIYVKTEGVLVVGIGEFEGEDGQTYSPAKYIMKTGDYILEMNDEEITGKKQLMEKIGCCEGQDAIFKIRRGEEELYVMAKPQLNENGEYKMGIWIRDNTQGIGMITFIKKDGSLERFNPDKIKRSLWGSRSRHQ